MQARNDRCAPCYGRRAALGLALAPLLVCVARTAAPRTRTPGSEEVDHCDYRHC